MYNNQPRPSPGLLKRKGNFLLFLSSQETLGTGLHSNCIEFGNCIQKIKARPLRNILHKCFYAKIMNLKKIMDLKTAYKKLKVSSLRDGKFIKVISHNFLYAGLNLKTTYKINAGYSGVYL